MLWFLCLLTMSPPWMSFAWSGGLLGGSRLWRIFLTFLKRVRRVGSAGRRCCLVLLICAHIHFVIVLPFFPIGINNTVRVAVAILTIWAATGAALALLNVIIDPFIRGWVTFRISLNYLVFVLMRLRGMFVMSVRLMSGLMRWRGGLRLRLRLVHKGEHLVWLLSFLSCPKQL